MRAGGPGWHFLTGDAANVERVCNAFGIQYFPDEGLITHSLQTAVVDRNGRLAATVEGKEFTPQAARRSDRDRPRAALKSATSTRKPAARSCKRQRRPLGAAFALHAS